MRNVPLKNYFILGIILLVSGVISIYLMLLFKNNNSVKNSLLVNELNFSELETYITENSDFVIYFASTNFKDSKFDKKFQKLIVENDLTNKIVYINKDELNTEKFQNFISKYYYETKDLSNYVIVFDDQKIASIIQITANESDLTTIKEAFKENGVL